jgi:tetratricopeptide (TPR) repeat protein
MKFSESKHRYKIIFLIVSLILYGNTLKNGYALDDEFVTGPANVTSKGFKAIPRAFKTFHVNDESGNNYEYRPMVKVSFAIESGLWGENLVLSHLVNIILYAVCLMVLFQLLKLIFNEVNEFIIFLIVLFFAFIPVHAEVVASLKNRDVMLSFIFSFYAFSCILQYMQTKKIYKILIAILMFGLAFLSKFDVFPLIAIIPFVIVKKYKANVKVIGVLIMVFIMALFVYKATKGTMLDRKAVTAHRTFQYFENPLYFDHDLRTKLSAGLNSLGFYGKMLLWPNKMVCYYGYNALPVFSFTSLFALFGLLLGGLLLYVFVKRFKKPDMLWYGVLIFSGFISMYMNVAVPVAGVVAERFLFFASIGFSLMVIYFFLKMKGTKSKITGYKDLSSSQKSISVAVLLIFALVVFNRNKEWKSKATLFEADVKKHPESVKLSLLTTSQLIINISDPNKSKDMNDNEKTIKIREAEELLKKAIQTDSSCGGCYNNLSFMYLTFERKPEEALPYLKLGYKLDSTKKEVICNIGIAYFRLGQVKEAEKYLLLAIKNDTKNDFSVPYEVLQDLYSRTDISKGINFFKEKLEEDHQLELMNVLLGKTYFEARDTANSIKYYQAALFINPNNSAVSDFVTKLEVKFNKKSW